MQLKPASKCALRHLSAKDSGKGVGSISISNGSSMRQRQIISKSIFFEGGHDYIIKNDDEKIVISRPSIDSNCRTYKATKRKTGWVQFHILGELPLGKFEFDSIESDNDRVVIYFR